MEEHLRFVIHRIKEKLWFRPLIFCIVSIGSALIAQLADRTRLYELVPDIKVESLSELLNIISASMLVIAIFTVGSMLSAFAAASNTATPRSFKLIINDDVSKNALSVFIGSFIFSIVALVALKNGYYGRAGLFTLFIFTLLFFTLVILTFLRWVERISKLGRMGHTIKLIEDTTISAITNRLQSPNLHGIRVDQHRSSGQNIESPSTGYIQQINMNALQKIAKNMNAIFTLHVIPGKFVSNQQTLLSFHSSNEKIDLDIEKIQEAFTIGNSRYFETDPRFGIITLSEIASRALSPAVNDPGTAIQIINSHIKLFSIWNSVKQENKDEDIIYDRIAVPEIKIADLFEDAFRPIARDGAANIEVMLRLQKAFHILSTSNNKDISLASYFHSSQAFDRAELVMNLEADIMLLKENCLI